MRKLALLTLLTLAKITFSQDYHQFPLSTDKPIWGVKEHVVDIVGDRTYYVYYAMIGDTVIEEKTFQKVYQLKDTSINTQNIDKYICAIRESEDSCIYRINKGETKLNKMFDYSLNVNDTASLNTEHDKAIFNLDSKNLIPLNGESYTEYIGLLGNISSNWIDGVGNTSNGIGWERLQTLGQYYTIHTLMTFKLNDDLIYGENFSEYTGNTTSISKPQMIQEINVYPNPIKRQSTLHLEYEKHIVHVSAYDIGGRLIKDFEGKDIKSLKLDEEIFASGVYNLVMVDENGARLNSKLLIE